jgi:hypothetical protein
LEIKSSEHNNDLVLRHRAIYWDILREFEKSFGRKLPKKGPIREAINSIRHYPNTDPLNLQLRTARRILKADKAHKAHIEKEKSEYAYGLKTGNIGEDREKTTFIDRWTRYRPDGLRRLESVVNEELEKEDEDVNVLVRIWTRANIELGLDIHQFHPFRVALLDTIIENLDIDDGRKVLPVMILLCPTSDAKTSGALKPNSIAAGRQAANGTIFTFFTLQ